MPGDSDPDASRMGRRARGAAAGIALVAWLGLALQLAASLERTHGLGLSLWALSRYFTILTNLAVALVFSGIAAGERRVASPGLVGGVTLAILLVGIVYQLLLRGLYDLSGIARPADDIVHGVVPVLVPLFWLVFVPKGSLTRHHAWIWAVPPLLYFAYGLVRGGLDGVYPYPFMNVGLIGWGRTALNAGAIAAGFILASFGVLWLDGRLARRR